MNDRIRTTYDSSRDRNKPINTLVVYIRGMLVYARRLICNFISRYLIAIYFITQIIRNQSNDVFLIFQ